MKYFIAIGLKVYCWHKKYGSIRCIIVVAGLSLASNFAEPEVHLTAIQALSNHKNEYGGRLEEFSALCVM